MSDVKIEHVEPLDLAAGYAVQRVEELEAENTRLKEELFELYKKQRGGYPPQVVTIFGVPFDRVWEVMRERGDI